MIGSFDIGEKNLAYVIGDKTRIKTWQLRDVTRGTKQTVLESCAKISELLDSEDWSQCSEIVIEKQVQRNVRALLISQHLWSWFSVKYPHIKITYQQAAVRVPRNLTYRERKMYAVDYVKKVLADRGDVENLKYLESHTKQDDLADAYLQLLKHK